MSGKQDQKKFVLLISESTMTSEYRYLPADAPATDPIIFQERERGHEYYVDHGGEEFFVLTNWDAKNFRLMKTTEDKTPKGNWQEVIPHDEDILLEGHEVFANFIAIASRKEGLSQVLVLDKESKESHFVEFPDASYVCFLGPNRQYETDELRMRYQALTTPTTVYDYHVKDRKLTLKKQKEVLGDFDPQDYESQRHFATTSDGVQIPISVVYKKGIKRNKTNPCLLYGYGSYGFSMDPWFNADRLSLLDRGFVFALAHIRGGSEKGRYWYEEGRQLNKKNTFTDFITCAEFMINSGYTERDHLYAMGGSAGGLLMGAVVNMRPDLFHGISAAVPFVDVITTMLDDSIPLTTGEYDEWGNPNKREYYDYIKSYSPYDNVKEQAYPHMLVTTGFHDSQVQYWEPAKWVAKLRELKTDNNHVLLKTEMEAGHGGKTGRFKSLEDTALIYSFFLHIERR